VAHALRAQPGLLPEYAAALAGGKAGGGLAHALLDYAGSRAGAGAAGELRSQLLAAICERVTTARERMPPGLLAGFGPLLAGGGSADFAAQVVPALAKALRRTPEPALSALAGLAAAAGDLDAGAAVPELLPLLLQQVRTKEALRGLALGALGALAARLPGAEAQLAAVRTATALLDGSSPEGRLKAAGERGAVWAALSALAAAPAAAEGGDAAAATAAVAAGAALYREEPVEEVRLALLGAQAAWLPRLASVPAAAAAQLAAGLGEAKEGLRRGHLRCLLAALRIGAAQGGGAAGAEAPPAATAGQLAPCMAPLLKLVGDGCAKATLRGDGLAALAAAAAIGAADPAAAQQLHAAPCWGGAVGPDSPLLAAATLGKLAPGEAAPAGQLAACLLSQHAEALPAGGADGAARVLALMLLHHARPVRSAAAAAARQLLAARPALMQALLAGLTHWMDNVAAAAVLAVSGVLAPSRCSSHPCAYLPVALAWASPLSWRALPPKLLPAAPAWPAPAAAAAAAADCRLPRPTCLLSGHRTLPRPATTSPPARRWAPSPTPSPAPCWPCCRPAPLPRGAAPA
jgi:hypothetical protein